MRYKNILGLLMLVLACSQSFGQSAIGQWRAQFCHQRTSHIERAGDIVYAATPKGVAVYDTADFDPYALVKGKPLSDAGVATIGYDPATQYLVIAYNNSNIDLLHNKRIYNLSDLKRADITGNKGIYAVRFHKGMAYLACGFGIVVIDLHRQEIAATYYLGQEGSSCEVFDIAFLNASIVAATSRGLMWANANDRFLNITDHWRLDTANHTGWQPRLLAVNGNELVIAASNFDPYTLSLFHGTEGNYQTWGTTDEIRSLRTSRNCLIVCGNNGISLYDTSHYQLLRTLTECSWWPLTECNDAVFDSDGTLWVAHNWIGLLTLSPFDLHSNDNNYTVTAHNPSGPKSYDNTFRLVGTDSRMLLCPGGRSSTCENRYLTANILTFKDFLWDNLQFPGGIDHGISDIVDVAVDPRNSKHLTAAAWGYGLLDILDNSVTAIYNDDNTPALQAYVSNNFHSLRTGGVAYDRQGNLWATSSLVDNGLVVHRTDGSWDCFNTSRVTEGTEIFNILCDSINGYIWFSGRHNRIYVHDGKSRLTYIDPNNGSKLETYSVNCITQDRLGNIWIGTNKGIKVIYDTYRAFNNGGNGEKSPVNCSNIVISNGEFIEYLMAYESISAIAVDGANRKWVGTDGGGLYLISANGLEEIQHFTAENSPLPSNKIITIAVQPESGDVFVGTDNGLVSYRGEATYAEEFPKERISTFPNPVTPDYDGPIAIKGFTRDALVHITDVAGHVVFTTRAQGGQAIWNGRTLDGKRVASGAYMVYASNESGENRSVGKVLIIR